MVCYRLKIQPVKSYGIQISNVRMTLRFVNNLPKDVRQNKYRFVNLRTTSELFHKLTESA